VPPPTHRTVAAHARRCYKRRVRLDLQHRLLARVREHLAAGTTDMGAHCLRAAAAHYASPAELERELRAWFRARPLLVALAPDLPAPGTYLARDAGDLPLLLTRAADGAVRAFVNACRHRGTRVAEGRGARERLVCPFHAWTYDLTGRVRARPQSCAGFAGIGDGYDALHELPCREVAGMIFVQREGDDIDANLEALVAGIREEVADYRIADHVYCDGRATERACNYKLVMDGFAESYHLKVLHKDTIAPYYYAAPSLADALGPVARVIGVRTGVEAELAKPPAEQRFLRHGTVQYLLPPNAVLCHQVDHLQLWQIHPAGRDPGRCRIALHLYWPAPVDDEGGRKAAFNLDVLWRVTTSEDFPQAEHIQAGLASGAVPELVFGRNEPGLVHYHEQMARGAGSESVARLGPR